ncbi:MAG: RNA polymerase sigma factor [Myxococcota bacterium]
MRAVPDVGRRNHLAVLAERARGGDTEAWRRLYTACFPDLMRHVSYMVFDVSLAEDIVQESFVVAFANIERYVPSGSFLAWVRGIAQNHVRRHWRKNARRQRAHARLEVVKSVTPKGPDPELQIRRERQADALSEAVAELPEKLREAFVLADLQELSAAAGAEILGITAANFRVRVFRARERLRAKLQEGESNDG